MPHLIITTANIQDSYESRKEQYIESIEACLKYRHFFHSYTILECVSEKEDYLNKYNTVYSTEGNVHANKGLNEMKHLRSFLNQAGFDDHQPIIKLSGKYLVEDDYFFKSVQALWKKYDSIFKNDNDVFEGKGWKSVV